MMSPEFSVPAENNLLKGNGDLKLVREAGIRLETARMGAMVQKMMEQCPICKQAMKQMQGMAGKGER